MKRLIKTIEGRDCEVFAVVGNQRRSIGTATPVIEMYQTSVEVNTVGYKSSRYKTYEAALIICSSPDGRQKLTPELLKDLVHFDLTMLLMRKDRVFVPFDFFGINQYDIDEYDRWLFDVNDRELIRKLLDL